MRSRSTPNTRWTATHHPPVGHAQEEADKPKSLREHIEAELASSNTALAEAKASKAYQAAADAKNQKDALTVALRHVDYLTTVVQQAEAKHDFETCAKVRRAERGVVAAPGKIPPHSRARVAAYDRVKDSGVIRSEPTHSQI